MSRIWSFNTRTSNLQVADQLLTTLRRTQRDLLTAQEQITTGKVLNRPSDAPARIAQTLLLREKQREREQTDVNLQHARSSLDSVDAALGDAADILLEAKSVAQTQIGIGSDAETRKTHATIIDGQLDALLGIANRQYQGVSLFGGNNSARPGEAVFESFLGGIRYKATNRDMDNDVGELRNQPFVSNGSTAFGALSSRVRTTVDLSPAATATTRLRDLNGAQLVPVRLGSVVVNVNGTDSLVDLTTADTMGDVANRITAAIQAIDPTASLTIGVTGFELNGGASTISISELGGGQTARDLGIAVATTPGVTTPGADVGPRLTRLTALSDLGAAVDFASGLMITHGQVTRIADFSAATTVEDLINEIDRLDLGLRLEINAAGTGLDLISDVSGPQLSIGENGGTTASDLGIRTYGIDTRLDDFRLGLGVAPKEGEADFAVELHDGSRFEVNLDGLATVGDVIAAIETAASAAGVAVPGAFDVSLATTGNGLVLTDNTAGAGAFRVVQINESLAASHLGINLDAGAGNTITGADNAKVQVQSVFSDLINLRDALLNDDSRGITIAGGNLEEHLDSVTQVRAQVGIQARRVEDSQNRSADLNVMEQSLLSDLQDADVAEVISRLALLQTQLQASMQIGANTLRQSLLDFL